MISVGVLKDFLQSDFCTVSYAILGIIYLWRMTAEWPFATYSIYHTLVNCWLTHHEYSSFKSTPLVTVSTEICNWLLVAEGKVQLRDRLEGKES